MSSESRPKNSGVSVRVRDRVRISVNARVKVRVMAKVWNGRRDRALSLR